MKRPPSHPDFDPRTLYVPERFLNGQTPGMKLWWIFKAKAMDCVLLFKVRRAVARTLPLVRLEVRASRATRSLTSAPFFPTARCVYSACWPWALCGTGGQVL
jgi:hypothetical protein